jgi:hypothetical protein
VVEQPPASPQPSAETRAAFDGGVWSRWSFLFLLLAPPAIAVLVFICGLLIDRLMLWIPGLRPTRIANIIVIVFIGPGPVAAGGSAAWCISAFVARRFSPAGGVGVWSKLILTIMFVGEVIATVAAWQFIASRFLHK